MATYKAVVLKGKNQVKTDGTANVKIRITHKRKADYIATDLYVIASQFDNKTGKLVTGATNENFINHHIHYET